jgi:thiamine biosynthesis lipoprotein
MALEQRFRAMGSDAHLIVVGGAGRLITDAARRVNALEQRWSRFLDDSEINRLNRRAGSFVTVSTETVTLITRSVQAWRLSGGAFDPTVLGDVIRAGYTRSFEMLGPAPAAGHSTLGTGADEIVVDGDAVQLAPGTGFDPGGIGKGLAADIVCAELIAAGADGACVNIGGDVRVAGAGPDGDAWTIAIELPGSAEPLARIGLADGAVATSTTLRRRWQTGGLDRHHLIDPRTGLPSDTDVTTAAVIAAEAWLAEILAKAVLLAGSEHPFDTLGGTCSQGIAVDRDGRVQATAGVVDFLGHARLPARLGPSAA